ncbi:hypothetical protein C5S30_01785 [ANME-1 cluster archaeon GoMg4]|nr:hypothetical protein [ANME-1 cluster archaeon GoMg4]
MKILITPIVDSLECARNEFWSARECNYRIVLAMIIDTLRVVINSVVRITDDRSAQFHRKGAG